MRDFLENVKNIINNNLRKLSEQNSLKFSCHLSLKNMKHCKVRNHGVRHGFKTGGAKTIFELDS